MKCDALCETDLLLHMITSQMFRMNVMEELSEIEVTQILNDLKMQTVPTVTTDTPVKNSLL